MEKYSFKEVESKWQDFWQKQGVFKTSDNPGGNKYYALDMFPYPSGAGLHVGHPEGYIATDIVSRFRKMKHKEDVLHPMGFDSFGLPAENYAIKVGANPKDITEENIKTFIRQLKSFGFSYDWDRQVVTSRPEYYKWTQWMFRELYKKNLAYKKQAPVNWCVSCKTVLAREQVINGKCDRCKNEVIQKNLNQWFFKITNYVEELLSEVENLDWPTPIKALQKNWIGKSTGARVDFKIKDTEGTLEVFTTRPDTLFGATFMVVAPEHPIIEKYKAKIENKEEVLEYVEQAQKKNELERTDLNKDKTGKEIKGLTVVNPVNNKEIPIFVADYVLMSYGTGAIMAVPAHDQRDFDFAKKYNLEIIEVISGGDITKAAFTEIESGKMVNSDFLDGLKPSDAITKTITWLEEKELGEKQTQYKLRDWLVSRQRYWGAPIPIIYCDSCGEVLVEEKDLPVELPSDVDFKPTGESPLASSKTFHQVSCPKCGKTEGVKRESDTMDTFVCSSWYFLRYADPHNDKEPFSKDKIEKWLPVDLYVGGAEHAVLHLMYARFFTKALADMGHLNFREPFKKLRNQGMILAEDGRKMSKSLGNVINPDDVIKEYGADIFRLYEMFMGPLEDSKPWDTKGILGISRFLNRIWSLKDKVSKDNDSPKDGQLTKIVHQTIEKVTHDIKEMKFNTAISSLMVLVNEMEKQGNISPDNFKTLVLLLSPFAPHISEELWQFLGEQTSVLLSNWPEHNPDLVKEQTLEIAIQVNGKLRDTLSVSVEASEQEIKTLALSSEKIKKWLEGAEPKKVIYIKGKIVSLVV